MKEHSPSMSMDGSTKRRLMLGFLTNWVGKLSSTVVQFIQIPVFLLKLSTLSESDTKWIIFYLGVSVLLGQLEQLLQSAYRAIGRYSYGTFLKNFFTLAAFVAIIASVALGMGPRSVALVFASINIAVTVFFCILVHRDIPWIEYGWQHASFGEIRKL